MVVMTIEQYVMCGDILREIIDGCPDSDAETLYELYLDQLRVCGIPIEETPDNVYEMPEQFRAWVEEVRNV
jgi:hypothetical protein